MPPSGGGGGNSFLAQSPLPLDLWHGLSPEDRQKLLPQIPLPSPSPALAELIARALATDKETAREDAIVMALERSGRVNELIDLLGSAEGDRPGLAEHRALALLAAGRDDEACGMKLDRGAEGAKADREELRARFLIPAYCAAEKGNAQGAGLTLQLAADAGIETPVASAVVAKLTKSSTRPIMPPKSPDLLDYLFFSLAAKEAPPELAAHASPELVFRLAQQSDASPELRLDAAERAAALNLIDGKALAAAYREAAAKLPKAARSPSALRAQLFVALENAPSAKIKGESIDALMASGKDAGIEYALAQALLPAAASLAQDPQGAAYAEPALRVAALGGDLQTAWNLVQAGGEGLRPWQLLLAAADPSNPNAQAALQAGAEIVSRGGIPPPLLQRLVTVLDGLDVDVPIPLWDAASKTPQPDDGYLPETGVLSALKQASDQGLVGPTILLAAKALGPKGPADANLIALGDSVKALKRVGLDAEARRVGFDALYARWPTHGKA